ncbi:MAG: topoisomerase I protein [Candidatus Azambacteria bacterium GW2011_GWB1_42_72]|nr:MAG: topoisomerase I protein [Candidatus Azambacteria bacterium GW2011_GWB1_42_72]
MTPSRRAEYAERAKEIDNFKPEEYWSIVAVLKVDKDEFEAQLVKIGEKKLEKFSITNKEYAEKIVSNLDGAVWKVLKIEKKESKRQPLAPFTTSTLQQTAWSWFGYGAKQTMMLAQQLYETGLITYMRTDSLNVSQEALAVAAEKIKNDFGNNYLATAPRIYKTRSKTAQEAHEAVRPTNPESNPEEFQTKLTAQQFKLYDLIWRRFIASQMAGAIFEATGADISAANDYIFRATGNVLKFDGFLKVYRQKLSENLLPILKENEALRANHGHHSITPLCYKRRTEAA